MPPKFAKTGFTFVKAFDEALNVRVVWRCCINNFWMVLMLFVSKLVYEPYGLNLLNPS